jgi:micrococcal nuclease
MTAPQPDYTYRAVVRRWVDGDTVHVDIDLGLRKWSHDEPLRLLGVNAPDHKPAKGLATAWVNDAAPPGTDIVIRTHLDEEDRYGRLLAELWRGEVYLNEAIIDAGHGQPYSGGARPEGY